MLMNLVDNPYTIKYYIKCECFINNINYYYYLDLTLQNHFLELQLASNPNILKINDGIF